ncbi:MAG: hypothetical protein IJX28_00120 [Clostridia bacterium]|nr:hypothetical protein [Clostridia bacterium]
MEEKSNQGFTYTYSAKEQAEIRRIREKYAPRAEEEDKMERLRRLDLRVTQRAQTVALILGVLGTLVLGLGMSLVMSDLGELLGAYRKLAMPLGILIGVLGCIPIGFAYPVYHVILQREREKIAPEILRLTEELLK